MKNWKKVSGKRLLQKWIKQNPTYEDEVKELGEMNKLGCRNCPIVCSNPQKIEYETINCLGPKLGIDDLNDIEIINTIYMNDHGIDVIQTTSIISALMEMSEKKVIGYKFEWGDVEHVKLFLSEFVNKENDILCSTPAKYFRFGFKEGMRLALHHQFFSINLKQLFKYDDGRVSKRLDDLYDALMDIFYVNVKGMGLSGVYPNHKNKGVALAVATSSRGADHLRSLPTLATYADWYFGSGKSYFKNLFRILKIPLTALDMMKSDASVLVGDLYKTYEDLFGVPHDIAEGWKKSGFLLNDNQVEGWGDMIRFTQNMYAVSDALSTCRFTSPWRFGVGPEILSEAIFYLTDIYLGWQRLLDIGERIYVLERELLFHYNQPVEDDLSKRFFKGKGSLTPEMFERLKTDYYENCRYDQVTGRPTIQTLNVFLINSFEGKQDYNGIYKVIIRSRSDKDAESSKRDAPKRPTVLHD